MLERTTASGLSKPRTTSSASAAGLSPPQARSANFVRVIEDAREGTLARGFPRASPRVAHGMSPVKHEPRRTSHTPHESPGDGSRPRHDRQGRVANPCPLPPPGPIGGVKEAPSLDERAVARRAADSARITGMIPPRVERTAQPGAHRSRQARPLRCPPPAVRERLAHMAPFTCGRGRDSVPDRPGSCA